MSETLDLAVACAKDWLEGLDHRTVHAEASLGELRAVFDHPLPASGTASKEVVAELYRSASPGMVGSASGRFFAWVIGGHVDSALAADWLVSTWDQNAALFACSPAASVIEEVAGKWILELLDLPRQCSFAFTTGCQLAHVTALAAARFSVLKELGWDVHEDGLGGSPAIRILTTSNRHASVDRALRLLGFGAKSIEVVDSDDKGRMCAESLSNAIASWQGPAILILNAADLNIGACDDFESLTKIGNEAGAWVHVDGAFGLMARASQVHRVHLSGVELADSWVTDGHKWLNVPFDCGIAIVRDAKSHHASMSIQASYIEQDSAARDQIDWTPEWSRRARGIPVYAALRELGRTGVESIIDECCRLCRELTFGIGNLPGAHIIEAPTLNQGLVAFDISGQTLEESNSYTDLVIEEVNRSGEAFFSGTNWHGRRAMRISVVNRRTKQEDVLRAINAVSEVLSKLTQ